MATFVPIFFERVREENATSEQLSWQSMYFMIYKCIKNVCIHAKFCHKTLGGAG